MTNSKILNDCSVTKPAINSTGRIRHRVRTGNFICHDLDENKSNTDIDITADIFATDNELSGSELYRLQIRYEYKDSLS